MKTARLLLCVMLATAVLLLVGIKLSRLDTPLLPAERSAITWMPRITPEPFELTQSTIKVNEDRQVLDWNFKLGTDARYPYTSYALDLAKLGQLETLKSLSKYDGISFRVRCTPQNTLLFVLFTFDEKVTDPSNHSSYRVSSTFFSCGENWSWVNLRFRQLDTPDWWLGRFNVDLADRSFSLDRVFGFGFVNSLQSPRSTPSNVKVAELRLVGEDIRFLCGASGLVILLWVIAAIWLLRQYVAALVEQVKCNVKRDMPLIAYQKLTVEPRLDKEKAAVITLMATKYANSDLDSESVVQTLGINRNKINQILKDEIGLTFSGYLNKLRLTEAARLLIEQKETNVAQIAFAVGYNNVTYFNKLFKNEYGCTPKSFKGLYDTDTEDPDDDKQTN